MRRRSPTTTSKSLLNLVSSYFAMILQAAYKTIVGPPTFFNLVEELDKAAFYHYTCLYYV